MENFTPKPQSFGSQLLSHPALHISMIFIVVFVAVAYIKGHEKKTFLEQVEKIPTGLAVIEPTPPPQQKEVALTASAQLPPPPGPEQPATNTAPVSTATPSNIPTPTASPATHSALATETTIGAKALLGGSAAADEQRRSTKVRIVYAEVDDLTLKKWIPEMQAAGQYAEADWRMGMLPNIEKKMAEDRSIVTLETIEKSFDGSHLNHEWFSGKSGDGQEAGLKASLNLRDWEGPQIRGEIKVTRSLDNSDLKVIESDLESPPKAGWVIWKVLNPKANVARELLDDPKSLFQIYRSARFKNERSDFTIFLVFDTPARR
jgi:hypothetical protein